MAGYPMRIILGMMVILPFLSKIAVKGSHLLFGKPQNSVLDEGKEDKMQAQAINQQLQLPPQLQQPLNQPQQTTAQTTTTTTRTNQNSNISPSNLLNPYKNGSTTTTTTTTKSSSSLENKPQEPVRTYIPSPVGVQIQNKEDLTAADAAMHRADLAEQQALQTLKMN